LRRCMPSHRCAGCRDAVRLSGRSWWLCGRVDDCSIWRREVLG
jgi:hypothetical protein